MAHAAWLFELFLYFISKSFDFPKDLCRHIYFRIIIIFLLHKMNVWVSSIHHAHLCVYNHWYLSTLMIFAYIQIENQWNGLFFWWGSHRSLLLKCCLFLLMASNFRFWSLICIVTRPQTLIFSMALYRVLLLLLLLSFFKIMNLRHVVMYSMFDNFILSINLRIIRLRSWRCAPMSMMLLTLSPPRLLIII